VFSYSATLPEPEQTFVSRVLAQVPSLADSIAVAKRLNTLLRRKSGGVWRRFSKPRLKRR